MSATFGWATQLEVTRSRILPMPYQTYHMLSSPKNAKGNRSRLAGYTTAQAGDRGRLRPLGSGPLLPPCRCIGAAASTLGDVQALSLGSIGTEPGRRAIALILPK